MMHQDATRPLEAARAPFPAGPSVGPSWLLQAKVIAPAPPAGYLPRAALQPSLDRVLDRRIVALQAPGGFGKTSELADLARRQGNRDVAVGWLSLDEDDSPDVFGNYLARSLEHAGLDLAMLGDYDAWSSSHFTQLFGLLARAIEAHARTCLLVLDEVERLPPRTVDLLDLLLKRSPRNLHFALGFRTNPGLDLVSHALTEDAIMIGTEQLLFSRSEIAQFFGGALTRRELEAVEERTGRWPVAVMIERNARAADAMPPAAETATLSANFVGVRLLRGISREDRDLLLDLAVFDWVEADVVDAVLGSSDARLRVTSLPLLDGLLQPLGAASGILRLHPLVKEYCASELAAADPEHKRTLHRKIALVLAERGHLRLAWRHATSAGDSSLVAELIERLGVLELWLREGVGGVVSAAQFLTPEITADHPRLALLRCAQLHFLRAFGESSGLYETVARQTDDFVRDRDGGDRRALAADRVFVETLLNGGWDASAEKGFDALLPAGNAPEGLSPQDRLIKSSRHLLRCIFRYQFADFEASRRHAEQARAGFAVGHRFGEVVATIHMGMGAMAQGRGEEALGLYRRARGLVKKFLPSEARIAASVDLLLIELDLERNRARDIRHRTLQGLTELGGIWNDLFVTALAVRAELTYRQYESNTVIQFLNRTMGAAEETGNANLTRCVSLQLALYLVKTGRVEEAAEAWTSRSLPTDIPESEPGWPWRMLEAFWTARVTLLAARGDLETAAALADSGWRISSERGLVRVAQRCLGLSMAVAHQADREERALAHLTELLRVTERVGYHRALAEHGDVSRHLLRRLAISATDTELRKAAESTLSRLGEPSASVTEFSPRELDVLAEVRQGLRNKEIAGYLKITEEGVRYHLRNIYRKAGVSKRHDAVRYAAERGLLR